MLSFANVLDLFPDKFTGLGGRGFSLAGCFARPLDRLLFWHRNESCNSIPIMMKREWLLFPVILGDWYLCVCGKKRHGPAGYKRKR